MYIISHVHWAHDYLGPFGILLSTDGLIQKSCVEKKEGVNSWTNDREWLFAKKCLNLWKRKEEQVDQMILLTQNVKERKDYEDVDMWWE